MWSVWTRFIFLGLYLFKRCQVEHILTMASLKLKPCLFMSVLMLIFPLLTLHELHIVTMYVTYLRTDVLVTLIDGFGRLKICVFLPPLILSAG